MKVKVELTVDVEDLPAKTHEALHKATSSNRALSELLEEILKNSQENNFSPAKIIEDINLVRENMLNVDLELSNASSMLINYEAARLNEAALDKERAEQASHEG